jgi:hypothetical protein
MINFTSPCGSLEQREFDHSKPFLSKLIRARADHDQTFLREREPWRAARNGAELHCLVVS